MRLEEAASIVLFSARKHATLNNLNNLDQACEVLDTYLTSIGIFNDKQSNIKEGAQESTTAGAILQTISDNEDQEPEDEEDPEGPPMRDLNGRIIQKRVWKHI